MKNLISFIRQEKGGLVVIFAIILPFIISCCALAFDGARILTKRARLADALNEAALSIATAGSAEPTDAEKKKLEVMLHNYIKTYLPNDKITNAKVDVSYIKDGETDKDLPIYSMKANIEVKTILPMDLFPSFAPTLELTNQGKVRKGLQDLGRPSDYVFVVDFSGSMRHASAETGLSRIDLLKKVVRDITGAALDAYPQTTFALVPFDTGVPVRYRKPQIEVEGGIGDIGEGIGEETDQPGQYVTNELGGDVNGCSVMMVPRKVTHSGLKMEVGYDLDYDFWSYHIYGLRNLAAPGNNSTQLPYTLPQITKRLDEQRYDYFNKYVIPSMTNKLGRKATWQDLVDAGWCVDNGSTTLPDRVRYSCEKDKSRSIFNSENQEKIWKEVEKARRLTKLVYDTAVDSIYNTDVVDVEATLNGMFDEKNIVNFPLKYTYLNDYGYFMCQVAGKQINATGPSHLENVRPNAYMIEPTNDINTLNEFQNMGIGNSTNSSSGLLRAVPEMLKGKNPRRTMIVISDGDDTDGQNLLHALHRDRLVGDKVCDRIRKGVHERTGAEVEIYFISVVNGAEDKARTNYWAQHCTGKDNAFIATDYAALMEKLTEIMSSYEETGYFYN